MKLNFRKIGEGPQPIIILHGIFGSSDNWITFAKSLDESQFSIYLLDQRNHGQSPWSEDFDYDYLADDLKEFIEDLTLPHPIIMGHSMGGKTVMQFDLKYPNIAKKIIIVDIAPKFYPVHHDAILAGLNSMALDKIQSRQDANDHLKRFIELEGIRQFILKNLYRDENQNFKFRINLKVITQKIDVVGHELIYKKHSDTPTFFIKGENSHYIQVEDERLIAEIFPNFYIYSVPNAGHWVQADNPIDFKIVFEQIMNQ